MIESTATPEIAAELLCPYCGYDLRGRDGDTCSECGGAVDDASLQAAMVPWERRKEIGRIKAFVKTAWRVTFQTKAFCRAVGMPVSYRDARMFQAWVVGLLDVAMAAVLWAIYSQGAFQVWDEFWGASRTLVCIAFGYVGFVGFTIFATGLHTYWLHPCSLSREYQNRAVALGYYACAAWLAVALGLVMSVAGFAIDGLLGVGSRHYKWPEDEQPGVLAGFVVGLLGLLMFWRVCVGLGLWAAHRKGMSCITLFVVQPILVLAAGFVLMIVVPFVAAYVWGVLQSL